MNGQGNEGPVSVVPATCELVWDDYAACIEASTATGKCKTECILRFGALLHCVTCRGYAFTYSDDKCTSEGGTGDLVCY